MKPVINKRLRYYLVYGCAHQLYIKNGKLEGLVNLEGKIAHFANLLHYICSL